MWLDILLKVVLNNNSPYPNPRLYRYGNGNLHTTLLKDFGFEVHETVIKYTGIPEKNKIKPIPVLVGSVTTQISNSRKLISNCTIGIIMLTCGNKYTHDLHVFNISTRYTCVHKRYTRCTHDKHFICVKQ